jgi:hypothetical protein
MIKHKIPVPIIFYGNVVMANARTKKVRAEGFVMHELEVTELSDDEAPLACVYKERSSPDGKRPVRYHEGKFFEPEIETDPDTKAVSYATTEAFLDSAARGTSYCNPITPMGGPVSEFLRGELVAFDSPVFRSYDLDLARNLISKADSRAKERVLIDGLLWREVNQPIYRLVRPVREENMQFDAFLTVDHLNETMRHSTVFALNQWDEGADYIKERFKTDPDENDKAEVYLTDVFGFDFSHALIMDALDKAVEVQRAKIGNADLETMLAWANFRDAVRRAHDNPNERTFAEAINRYGAEYRASPQADKWAFDHLQKAEEHWNMSAVPARSDIRI